jgi:hypothetical protein
LRAARLDAEAADFEPDGPAEAEVAVCPASADKSKTQSTTVPVKALKTKHLTPAFA